jgi:hypothetical protein
MIYGFDIEIAKGFPEDGSHWSVVAPLGVTCAALSDATGERGMLWYSAPGQLGMSQRAIEDMINFVAYVVKKGDAIVTWNGLGFDWRALTYEVPAMTELLQQLASRTYDPMYAIFKLRGFPVGLNNACIGQGVEGKLEDVGGAAAVKMWNNPLLRGKVLQYVAQDARATAEVAKRIRDTGIFKWMTGRKTISGQEMSLLPTRHFLDMSMPDQTWMDTPLSEANFTSWL